MNWVQQLKSHGLGAFLDLALDILEPLGPLGAQVLWAALPVFGVFGGRDQVADLARTLEEPGGIDELRRQLELDR